ncbi:hypothetical protein [Oscillibacter ruminantium]|uniref:hypothetical protein n=1 Tax=Oscillibacter ruminantium TaxID=1263547 RepID=UPI0002EA52D7|nr:hypothetical protein [Oscillibacter ruminantium]
MNIDELYRYIGERTGMRQFHITFEEGVTEFTQEEADKMADLMLSLYSNRKKRSKLQ